MSINQARSLALNCTEATRTGQILRAKLRYNSTGGAGLVLPYTSTNLASGIVSDFAPWNRLPTHHSTYSPKINLSTANSFSRHCAIRYLLERIFERKYYRINPRIEDQLRENIYFEVCHTSGKSTFESQFWSEVVESAGEAMEKVMCKIQ
jgi:hypothetical protein